MPKRKKSGNARGLADQDHEQNMGETTGHSRAESSNMSNLSPAFGTCQTKNGQISPMVLLTMTSTIDPDYEQNKGKSGENKELCTI